MAFFPEQLTMMDAGGHIHIQVRDVFGSSTVPGAQGSGCMSQGYTSHQSKKRNMENTLKTNTSELWAQVDGCLALLKAPDDADKWKGTVERVGGEGAEPGGGARLPILASRALPFQPTSRAS